MQPLFVLPFGVILTGLSGTRLRGGRVAMVLGKLPVPGRPINLD